jgi:hypothetical protein
MSKKNEQETPATGTQDPAKIPDPATRPADNPAADEPKTKGPKVLHFEREDGDLYEAVEGSAFAKDLAGQQNFKPTKVPNEQ